MSGHLSGSILGKAILKLDEVKAEGDERVRTQRKELVQEAQGWLADVEEAERNSTARLVCKLWHTYHQQIAPLCIEWALDRKPFGLRKSMRTIQYVWLSNRFGDIFPRLIPLETKAKGVIQSRVLELMKDVRAMSLGLALIKSGWKGNWKDKRRKTSPEASGLTSGVILEIDHAGRLITSRDRSGCDYCARRIRVSSSSVNQAPEPRPLRHLDRIATPKISSDSSDANSDAFSVPSRSVPQSSATYKHTANFRPKPLQRSETMPVDCMQRGESRPLTSSDLKNMDPPSDLAYSDTDSEIEMTYQYEKADDARTSRFKSRQHTPPDSSGGTEELDRDAWPGRCKTRPQRHWSVFLDGHSGECIPPPPPPPPPTLQPRTTERPLSPRVSGLPKEKTTLPRTKVSGPSKVKTTSRRTAERTSISSGVSGLSKVYRDLRKPLQ
ncbi:hypothetical protein OEA41_003654 [Lepraria neglecta]|uniref:BAG domain-containing protein n=1 Tax=Lepraria neglecta TaxID=209136 RepID=A0AAD9Z550_9LECA|nr:hypothetical protein OEA41_003654 [Lepraria neglecta]